MDSAVYDAYSLNDTSTFRIRFQQYDRYNIPNTGICYDDIRIYPQ